MDSVERRSATPGMKTGLATQTAQKDQFRTRIAMTAAVQLGGEAKEQLADRHRRVERSAMRDPTTARMRQRCVGESRVPSQGAERDL